MGAAALRQPKKYDLSNVALFLSHFSVLRPHQDQDQDHTYRYRRAGLTVSVVAERAIVL